MAEQARECAVCRRATSDHPTLLTVNSHGTKRYMCDECATLAKRASRGTDYDDIIEAIGALSLRLTRFNIGDVATVEAVGALIDRASSRAAAIKDGTYDFSLDPSDGEESPDTADSDGEAVGRDAAEARSNKSHGIDKVANIASIGVLAAALIGCIIYIIFFS